VTSPLLWFANRGTGVVLLVLFTLTTVGGVLATGRATSTLWPRFVTQGLHRTLGLLSSVLLLVHVTTAVVDEYVDIRWWQALVPFGATYKPLFLSLGTLALDLTVAIVVTSLLRSRLNATSWRAVHLTSYVAWVVSVVHSLGIGTDVGVPWFQDILIACVVAVVVAVAARVIGAVRLTRRSRRSQAVVRV
jgi:DMSO/TMAO reductase YedYZ heme-binding membrane subunit